MAANKWRRPFYAMSRSLRQCAACEIRQLGRMLLSDGRLGTSILPSRHLQRCSETRNASSTLRHRLAVLT